MVSIGLTLLLPLFSARGWKRWKNYEWWHIIKNLKDRQSKDILTVLDSIMPWSAFEEFCTKLCGVWKDLCTYAHSSEHRWPLLKKDCTDHWAEAHLDSFRKAQVKLPPRSSSLLKTYSPDQSQDRKNCFFVFIDAAYNSLSHVYATNFAIYDPRGNICVVGYHRIPPWGTVMAAELQTIHDGISYWKDHRPSPLKVFSDSTDAIHSIRSDHTYKGIEDDLITS